MGIDSRHPLYEANIARWQKCRDVYEGQEAVKAGGKKYLPRPGGLDDTEFAAYVERAMFYEAAGRTIDGFVGAIARKDPTITVPVGLEPVVENATADGLSLPELQKRLCAETIGFNRNAILVDYDDAKQRCFMVQYNAESITNWGDNGEFYVLYETAYETEPDDKFKRVAIPQYRELSLIDGVYTVTIWRKAKPKDGNVSEWAVYETIVPKKRGQPFNTIPFFWLTTLGKTSRIEKPPLMGLVNVCVSHYHNSADLEHGLHFTGLPTPYVTGSTPDDDKPLRIGSATILQLPESDSKVGYLEFTGQGLDALFKAMEAKQAMMAVLGASVFHEDKKGVEAEATARIRTSGETSLLSGVVTAVEETLETALECCAEWMGVAGEIEVTLNREYIDTTMDGATLTGLVQAYQAGALSLEQFLYNLQQGELLAPDTDLVEEAALVTAAAEKRAAAALDAAVKTKTATAPKN